MPNVSKPRLVCALVLSVGLLIVAVNVRVMAQSASSASGTILGTVTDSSGGVIPDAKVQVTNTGTSATQVVTSDAQGRYRVPDLSVGDYQVSIQQAGFQAVVHTGITLNPGANVVVDFSMPVGQVTQTVEVTEQVSQVETTSAALSTSGRADADARSAFERP